MEKAKQEKIKRFMNDRAMSEVVYEVLLDAFLDDKASNEVNYLAASRLSVNFLKEAWKRLERLRDKEENDVGIKVNVGV